MSSVNKVFLVGRLGRDVEYRTTGNGKAVANFSLATDETFKDAAGEKQKRTEWHKVVMWGKSAEIADKYLHKGSLVFVEGRIQSREWTDKQGQARVSVEIVSDNFTMLGPKDPSRGSGDTFGAPTPNAAPTVSFADIKKLKAEQEKPAITTEDIPF